MILRYALVGAVIPAVEFKYCWISFVRLVPIHKHIYPARWVYMKLSEQTASQLASLT